MRAPMRSAFVPLMLLGISSAVFGSALNRAPRAEPSATATAEAAAPSPSPSVAPVVPNPNPPSSNLPSATDEFGRTVQVSGLWTLQEAETGTWVATMGGVTDQQKLLIAYSWTYGDGYHSGKIRDSESSHSFSKPGRYSVKLVVQWGNPTEPALDGNPLDLTVEFEVVVKNSNPTIEELSAKSHMTSGYVTDSVSANTGHPINFRVYATDKGVNENPLTLKWTFGDCTAHVSTTMMNPGITHAYSNPGTYIVTAQVLDDYEGYTKAFLTVNVIATSDQQKPFSSVTDGQCDQHALCERSSAKNFTCTCNLGFEGNGVQCTQVQNPCRAGGKGYTECDTRVGSAKKCLPEIVDPRLTPDGVAWTGEFSCGSCGDGYKDAKDNFERESCVRLENPCVVGSIASTCRAQGSPCLAFKVYGGKLFTGVAACATECPEGSEQVDSDVRYCVLKANPCLKEQPGYKDCNEEQGRECKAQTTDAGLVWNNVQLYTGEYSCNKCAAGLQEQGNTCVEIKNTCEVGQIGAISCGASKCIPHQEDNAFTAGFSCNLCALGWGSDYIDGGLEVCVLNPNPCDSLGACGLGQTCIPTFVTDSGSRPLYHNSESAAREETKKNFCGGTCSEENYKEVAVGGVAGCFYTAPDNSGTTIGIAVGVVVAVAVIVIVAVLLYRRHEASKRLEYTYNEGPDQVAVLYGDDDGMMDDWDNPLAALKRGSDVGEGDFEMKERRPVRRSQYGHTHITDLDLSPEELIQLENPLYIPEEEDEVFANPLSMRGLDKIGKKGSKKAKKGSKKGKKGKQVTELEDLGLGNTLKGDSSANPLARAASQYKKKAMEAGIRTSSVVDDDEGDDDDLAAMMM